MSAFSSQNPLYGLSQRPSNQGWLFHPKMPYTGNQDDFSAATGVHPNRFQHAFIQTQSMGASPHTPKTIFHRPLVAYAAGVPERGFFRCRRKRMARLGETWVNAHHIFFLTNGCRLGVGKLWHFTFFSVWLNTCGDDKIFMTSWRKSGFDMPPPLYAKLKM